MNFIKKAFAKYTQMGKTTKAAAWYTVCNILQRGIAFLTVPIYVRMLTTAEYGGYTVFQSWREILMIFATLNLYCGVFTKAMVDYPEERARYTSSIQTLSTLATAVLFAVYLTAIDFWNGCLDMGTVTVVMMLVYFIVYPAFLYWSEQQRVLYRYKLMIAVTLLISVLTPVVSILLLEYSSLREEAVIWGYLSVQIAVGIFFYVYNFVKGKCFFSKEYWSRALKYNIPLIPHYLSLIALSQIDRIMIKSMCGDEKAGIYSFTFSVSQLMYVFINAINSAIVPWVYQNLKDRQYKAIAKTSNWLCLFIGVMSLGVMLVSPEIVGLMGTADYMEAIWIIPAVTLGVYFTFVYGMFANVEFYYSATRFVMVASIVAAVAKIAANALLIPRLGYIVAGYTTLGCYILLALMHYLFMKKVCRKMTNGESVYNIKILLLISVAMLGGMLVCLLLYEITLVRYAVIAAIVIAAVVFRKRIIGLIKQLT